MIQTKLENDETLPEQTEMRVNSMLLTKCMESSYFTYNGGFYQQTEGAAMGSPLSPILANLFMEWFEEEAIRTTQTNPTLWLRYVDDTFVLWQHERDELDRFLTHLNNIRPSIQFTMEIEKDGRHPFLDTEVIRNQNDGTAYTWSTESQPTLIDTFITPHTTTHKSRQALFAQ